MSGLPACTCDKPSSLAYQDRKQLQDENHTVVGKWRHKKQVSFQQKAQVNANMPLVSNKSSSQTVIPCIFAFLLFDFHFFFCLQIGCFMGFSITTCVLTGIMFITYCVALAEFNEIIRCRKSGYDWNYGYYNNRYCYPSSYRHTAAVGLGLGSCMLIFTIVEFILALSSSIYCCNAVCCNASTGAVNTVHVSLVHAYVYMYVYICK